KAPRKRLSSRQLTFIIDLTLNFGRIRVNYKAFTDKVVIIEKQPAFSSTYCLKIEPKFKVLNEVKELLNLLAARIRVLGRKKEDINKARLKVAAY
ncbi:hypothetical protein L249_1057, partial [Ophiocordyceps polyrhachis-furcata BCC 54312]